MQVEFISAKDHAQTVPAAIARDTLNYASWGGALPLAQYLSREAQLWRHPFSQRGLRLWLLRDGDQVLASCETYAVGARRCPPAGPAVLGTAHGVASVYVAEALRGHGYASALLHGVQAQLRAEGAVCTYLMSEVAPTIYERLGYVARPVLARRYPALSGPAAAVESQLEWLALDALQPALLELPPAPLQLQIDPAFVHWHIERGQFHAACLGAPRQTILGVRSGQTWALCADEPREGLLRILAVRSDGQAADLQRVISGVQILAGRQGLPLAELWENESNRQLPWPQGGATQAAEAVPMLCPLQASIDATAWQSCERGLWI